MSEPRSLRKDLQERLDARPEPWVQAMMDANRKHELEIRGISFLQNTAVGSSREAIEAVTVLATAIEGLRAEHIQLLGTVSELREKLEAMSERLDRQGKWITDNSKKAKP